MIDFLPSQPRNERNVARAKDNKRLDSLRSPCPESSDPSHALHQLPGGLALLWFVMLSPRHRFYPSRDH